MFRIICKNPLRVCPTGHTALREFFLDPLPSVQRCRSHNALSYRSHVNSIASTLSCMQCAEITK